MDSRGEQLERRDPSDSTASGSPGDQSFLDQFVINDTDTFTTTDFGTPVDDTHSLKAGSRGPTLLEDFVFRTKLTRFDHERVPERAVHARGAGAHGYFESYGDWSNITAASFLTQAGKQTPVFLRFSTVAGSRGSADTARDVHGTAVRFYTDEGNFDIVGNNIPVFFIQDAIQFPDLIHAVKPSPDNEIPQAATAHDSAYDFFSRNPSTLHTLMWALSGHGIPRSFRHLDGFGVHTFRLVTDSGQSKLVKFHFKSLQGKASLIWPEAQALGGQDADAHRRDLWNAIEAGHFPEWEMAVQIMNEEDALAFGFDLLDPTKIVPQDIVPLTPIGKLVLNRNPTNYFAETEQVMFSIGHVVRGIDFTEDPLMQGRLFSYVDTQLNRAMGSPNFEQIPINRPRSRFGVHNVNRDGAMQQFIPSSIAPYMNNTLNSGSPRPATQNEGGFFTAPARRVVDGNYVRDVSPTFLDYWTQPRLFWNSILPAEQQMVVNALRFELGHVQTMMSVRQAMVGQLNRISNDLAVRVASAIGVDSPSPDPQYYHENKTIGLSVFNETLKTVVGLNVAVLSTTNSSDSLNQAKSIAQTLSGKGLNAQVVAEVFADGVDTTYIASDAALFDGVVVADGTSGLFDPLTSSMVATFPPRRPLQIVMDAYSQGKAIVAVGNGNEALSQVGGQERAGVRIVNSTDSTTWDAFEDDLKQFKFLDRYPMDPPSSQ
ncbi:catalase B precursor [Dendrothele bispora CBS 962.96]|uniref:Catalase n=1 Tax=Dendrothele bispora (strain CBS 962.96) TaxID=1314807 RepID=A0A4S8MKN1_DENBC|nr:catalase B precursor [Dendrothele bispora CBS 962.96]